MSTTRLQLTETQMSLLLAAWEMGGGGRESELQLIALRIEFKGGGGPPSTLHNHYSGAADQLVDKGLLRTTKIGRARRFWLTDAAMRELDQDGPAPTDPEQPLF